MRKELEAPWLYEKPWYKPGKWDVSHFTFNKTVRERMPNLPTKVLPTDTTLREGLHMAGVTLSTDGYLEVASRLAKVGVKETDCGMAADEKHLVAMKQITDAGIKISTRIITRFMSDKAEIDAAVKYGADVIKIQCLGGKLWRCKVSRPELYDLFVSGKYIPLVLESIKYIKNEYPDIYVQAGITSATHMDIAFLKKWAKALVDAGADRISLSDSRGVGTQDAMQYLCSEIRSVIGGADLEVHCHNDFGLALSNTIGSVLGGCTSFDCTINGIGDRAGNAALEECCVALELLYGVDTGVKLDKLYDLCMWIQDYTGVKVSRAKPLVGSTAFMEQAESHIAQKWKAERLGLTDDWFLAFSPSVVGRTHTAVWGASSLLGDAIKAKIDSMGLSCTDGEVEEIRRRTWEILGTMESGEAWITDPDFEKIITDVLKK